MNRERRERGPLLPSRLSVPTLEGRGNLLLGLFLEPLRIYKGHSLFCSRFSRISRLVLLRTLLLNSMNRERHERGPLLPSRLSVPTLEGRGNLLLGLFLEPLRIYKGHSLFCSRFSRISRLVLLRTLRFRIMNREQRERREHREANHKIFRG